MKAVIYTRYGDPSVLQLAEINKPVPKDDEVLVQVHASSVSIGNVWLRKGAYPGSPVLSFFIRLLFGITRPRRKILGIEFSGIITEAGKNVTRFRKGDEVYGTTTGLKNGAYAEYVCVPEKWKQGVITARTGTLSHEEAAAFPVGSMTALQLLRKAKMKPLQNVLIYGASGSVGSYAVQLAKYYGANVTAVCSTANIALAYSLGADLVIDYTTNDLLKYQQRFDVVIDAVNKMSKAQKKQLLKKRGTFISAMAMTNEKVEYLEEMHEIIAAGKLRPVIDRIYPLQEIVAAHAYVDKGHKKGNVVIGVRESPLFTKKEALKEKLMR